MDSRQSRTVILETNKSVEQYDQHVLTWIHFLDHEEGEKPNQSKAVSLSWRRNWDWSFWKLKWLKFAGQNPGEKRDAQKKSYRNLHGDPMRLVECSSVHVKGTVPWGLERTTAASEWVNSSSPSSPWLLWQGRRQKTYEAPKAFRRDPRKAVVQK